MKDNLLQMPSSIVLVRGTLRGTGGQADCDLLMRKRRLVGKDSQGKRLYEYTEWRILSALPTLPDGEYIVTTDDGFSFVATRLHQLWLHGQPGADRPISSKETA